MAQSREGAAVTQMVTCYRMDVETFAHHMQAVLPASDTCNTIRHGIIHPLLKTIRSIA